MSETQEIPNPRSEFRIWLDRTFGTADQNHAKKRTIGGYLRTVGFVIIYFAFAGTVTFLSFISYYLLYPIFGISTAQLSVDTFTEWFFLYQGWMFENYVQTKLRFFGDKIPDRESAFIIGNHQWIFDWAVMFCLGCGKGMAGACKFFAKKSVLYIPMVGLGLWIMHGVFLERNWDRDKSSIEKCFERQKKLKGHPVWMFTWPESTRNSPEKRVMSHAFAKEHGLPLWEHVLVPRSKGFIAQVKGLRDIVPALYDITVAYGGPRFEPPTPLDMGCGGYGNDVSFYFKRYAMDDLPHDDEGLKQWLFDRWQEKEDLLEYYKTHRSFPGKEFEEPFRYIPIWKSIPTEKKTQ